MTDVDALARLIWENDGPIYTGWPNIGERVHWEYRDQYSGQRDRCIALARVILKRLADGKGDKR